MTMLVWRPPNEQGWIWISVTGMLYPMAHCERSGSLVLIVFLVGHGRIQEHLSSLKGAVSAQSQGLTMAASIHKSGL